MRTPHSAPLVPCDMRVTTVICVLCAGSRHTSTPHVFLGRTAGRGSARRRRPAADPASGPHTHASCAELSGSTKHDPGAPLWPLRVRLSALGSRFTLALELGRRAAPALTARTTPRDEPRRRVADTGVRRTSDTQLRAPPLVPAPPNVPRLPVRPRACRELLRLAGPARRTLADVRRGQPWKHALCLGSLGSARLQACEPERAPGTAPPAAGSACRSSTVERSLPPP